ncbi:hypothetical protein LSTR_LSTR013650 [Laodelphax striatellus]|uniref:Uncharacterized protein n=1 Tax=Laodelphax striatellus TaxID=195883 RepID=A0A482WL82_LAOST|nr:hypothetical protein LSTR_LSTR013650 [Laodelphax striatellus]
MCIVYVSNLKVTNEERNKRLKMRWRLRLVAIVTLVCATVEATKSSPATAADDSEEDSDYDAGLPQVGVTLVDNSTHTVEPVNVNQHPGVTCEPGFRPDMHGQCRPRKG